MSVRLGCDFEGRKGDERARFPQPAPSAKTLLSTNPAAGERGADPSEVLPRRGKTSVPEKHSQAGRDDMRWRQKLRDSPLNHLYFNVRGQSLSLACGGTQTYRMVWCTAFCGESLSFKTRFPFSL